MLQRRVVRTDSGQREKRSVSRFDTCRFDSSTVLPNGMLRVDALVTSSGVYTYYDDTGNPVREYRPPEEVQAADSIATLRDLPVTVLHPPVLVDSANWDDYAVGHVSGEPVSDGVGVKAKLIISQQDAIGKAQARDLQEISCGYQVTLDMSSGVTPQGEKYDAVQRDIRYNHIAMGPAGWGRQGSSVSLRLDHAGNQVFEKQDKGDHVMKITIVFDGKTYEVTAGSAEHNDLLRKIAEKDQEIKAKLDAAAALQGRIDAVTAERDVMKKQLADITVKLDAAPAAAIAAARARLELEASARTVLGSEFKFDGPDGKPVLDRDVRIAIISKYDSAFNAKDLSDDYVRAACDTYQKRGATQQQEQMVLDQAGNGTGVRKDGQAADPCDPNDPDPEAARIRSQKRDGRGQPRLSVSFAPVK